jgi:hypothetical protein
MERSLHMYVCIYVYVYVYVEGMKRNDLVLGETSWGLGYTIYDASMARAHAFYWEPHLSFGPAVVIDSASPSPYLSDFLIC